MVKKKKSKSNQNNGGLWASLAGILFFGMITVPMISDIVSPRKDVVSIEQINKGLPRIVSGRVTSVKDTMLQVDEWFGEGGNYPYKIYTINTPDSTVRCYALSKSPYGNYDVGDSVEIKTRRLTLKEYIHKISETPN